MTDHNTIKNYLSLSKNLTPLYGKRPILDNWTTVSASEEQIYAHKGNVGWVLGEDDLVVDVDPKNGGQGSYDKLCSDLNVYFTPTVRTPSGGFHVYLCIEDKHVRKDFRKTISDKYKGIDFLTRGAQCVIPSSKTDDGAYTWYDDIFGGFEQNVAPDILINLITRSSVTSNHSSSGDDLGDFNGLLNSTGYWTAERVLEKLSKLDPSIDNDQWVKVGMALHEWSPTEGLALWEQWSIAGDNYVEGETEKRWKSFTSGGGVTMGTVGHMGKLADFDTDEEYVAAYVERISLATQKQIQFEIIPQAKKEAFTGIHLEMVAKALQKADKSLSGAQMPISVYRNKLKPFVEFVKGEFVEEEVCPDWCHDWVYVNASASYYNIEDAYETKSEGFNLVCGKRIPRGEGGGKKSASKFVAEGGFVERVDAMGYNPTTADKTFACGDRLYVNSFNAQSVPKEALEFTDGGLAYIERVKAHVNFLFGDEHCDFFTQWMAHQVQYPGRKLKWCPLVQSEPGAGKSFMADLMRACIGVDNVDAIGPDQVSSDFKGWASGSSLVFLEELRMSGHNRHTIADSMKTYITDNTISINEKGVKRHKTVNHTNYIAFTNHRDAVPLDDVDRRWWIIFAPELPETMKGDICPYFLALFGGLNKYADELRKWLLEYAITEAFLSTNRAPDTKFKQSMIVTERGSTEGLEEAIEMIEEGGKYFNKDIISSSDLFDAMVFKYPELDIEGRNRNRLLKKLGYSQLPKVVYIDGKTRRMWAKNMVCNKKARLLLLDQDKDLDDL